MDELRSFVPSSARARFGKGKALGGALTLAVAGVMAVSAIAPAAASACPSPPALHLYFNGTQSEGVIKVGKNASASAVSGNVSCGLLNEVGFTFTIPASGVTYNPFTLKLFGFLPLEGSLTVEGETSGALSEVPGSGGTEYNTHFTTPVSSTVSLLIFKCSVGPFSPTLTTEQSGSLHGETLKGSIASGLSGTLVANEFAIPAITPTSSCPGFIAGLTDFILGAPLAAGQSSITTHATLAPA
jgi:hypothetical protein